VHRFLHLDQVTIELPLLLLLLLICNVKQHINHSIGCRIYQRICYGCTTYSSETMAAIDHQTNFTTNMYHVQETRRSTKQATISTRSSQANQTNICTVSPSPDWIGLMHLYNTIQHTLLSCTLKERLDNTKSSLCITKVCLYHRLTSKSFRRWNCFVFRNCWKKQGLACGGTIHPFFGNHGW
jgi:hypothetical protein